MKIIKLYTQPGCQPCRAVKRWLDNRGIEHTTIDVRESPEDAAAIAALGYTGTPVTIVNDGTGDVHFGGFNVDLLQAYCVEKDAA